MRNFTFKRQLLFVMFMLLGCLSIQAADDDLITKQIIIRLDAHAAESWCVLDDEIFPDYEQLQIVEKLVKTCYMDGLTDDCVNEVKSGCDHNK